MNQKLWILGILILLCSVFAFAEEGCMVYDTVDKVYLTDSNCDGLPDNMSVAEQQNEPATVPADNTPVSQPEEIVPISAQTPAMQGLAISYIGQRSIEAGKADYYAIKIANNNQEPAAINVQVYSIRDWGSYRLEPSSRITVQPGNEETLFVFITVDADAAPGDRQILVNLNTDSESKTLKLNANIISESASGINKAQLQTVLIILIIVIFIIGLILGYDMLRKRKKEEEHSYY